MPLFDLEGELSAFYHIIIRFHPAGQSSEFRTRKFRDGTEIQSIDGDGKEVDNPGNDPVFEEYEQLHVTIAMWLSPPDCTLQRLQSSQRS